jgi:hypothetical protein
VRKRLLVCGAFGLLGLAAGIPVSDYFGIGIAPAFGACAGAGLVLGYVVSIMVDVFLGGAGETESETES